VCAVQKALNGGQEGLPLKVINDGEVTALAGYQMLHDGGVPADMEKLQQQVAKFQSKPDGVFGICGGPVPGP
jgi:hypothetical protein